MSGALVFYDHYESIIIIINLDSYKTIPPCLAALKLRKKIKILTNINSIKY